MPLHLIVRIQPALYSLQSSVTFSVVSCAGVTAKVIYSGGADLDILPQHASKGKGLEFLLGEVRHSPLHCYSLITAVPLHCIHLSHLSYICISLYLHLPCLSYKVVVQSQSSLISMHQLLRELSLFALMGGTGCKLHHTGAAVQHSMHVAMADDHHASHFTPYYSATMASATNWCAHLIQSPS